MKKLEGKLSLKKEKVSILEADELDKVQGGAKSGTNCANTGDTGTTNGVCCSDNENTCVCTSGVECGDDGGTVDTIGCAG